MGKTFIKELAEQIQNFVDSRGMDSTVLYNLMAFPALKLQKRTRESCGYKVATEHLRRRLALWTEGDLSSLLEEGRCLQKHVHARRPGGQFRGDKDRAREFGLSMVSGQVLQALRMLAEEASEEFSSGVLWIGETVTLAEGLH